MILHYRIYSITIILGECCPKKTPMYRDYFYCGCIFFIIMGVFFIIAGVFHIIIVGVFSFSWVLFPYSIYSNIQCVYTPSCHL